MILFEARNDILFQFAWECFNVIHQKQAMPRNDNLFRRFVGHHECLVRVLKINSERHVFCLCPTDFSVQVCLSLHVANRFNVHTGIDKVDDGNVGKLLQCGKGKVNPFSSFPENIHVIQRLEEGNWSVVCNDVPSGGKWDDHVKKGSGLELFDFAMDVMWPEQGEVGRGQCSPAIQKHVNRLRAFPEQRAHSDFQATGFWVHLVNDNVDFQKQAYNFNFDESSPLIGASEFESVMRDAHLFILCDAFFDSVS